MTNNKIEIMSPVGSFEALAAAIQAGAGSIYFGVDKLNMRARASAQNFTVQDLKEISEICSNNKVKSYLALNIVVYDEEIEEACAIIDAAKENNISAIIASDLAVIQYACKVGVEVHISTQCNVSNFEAVKFYSQFADVIVLARELNIRQIKNICDKIKEENICGPSGELLQIELFVHGALCMSISGKCYLSLDTYGSEASANRGSCYQLCRRQYTVYDKDREIEMDIDGEYIMSPKDLKTIEFLDQILAAGVTVLKIEGRGRGPEYVKTVTQCYKEAVEAVANKSFTQEKINNWDERLTTVFNRGFCSGYYLGRNMIEWTELYGNRATKVKKYIGTVTNYFTKINVAELTLDADDLSVGDEIMIIGPTTGVEQFVVNELHFDDKSVDKVAKGEACSIHYPV
ncbi:U32 family peptidase, partial [Odoribacter sp. OttesenSCG-928-L07]|nr:U32 family peptidase [Odoribacter sp. OttesenSCG-928-L07]MDL2239731.1 U32 family peptidase [Bacteroidales bacterium OttesenSCG-928-L14]